jgi:hypothetical protein
MELNIKDRLYIPAFLPKEGNFKQFNLKKEILKKIEISDTERSEVNLRENEETKRIEWDIEKEIPLHIDFSSDEMEYLKMVCEKVSEESLPDDMWASISKIYDTIASH